MAVVTSILDPIGHAVRLLHECNPVLIGCSIRHAAKHWWELLRRHPLKLRHLHLWHRCHSGHALRLAWCALPILATIHHRLHLLELHEVLLGDKPADLRVGGLVELLQFLDITSVRELLDVLLGGEIRGVLPPLVLFDK